MRKWGPLIAVCLGTFMLLLDVTIVIVALPDMAGSLHASLSDLQWVIDIYALALAALLLGAGAAADVTGRRRLYAAGTALFALASLACGLSTSPAMLIAMRGLQGVGGAAMFATTLSLLGAAYQGRDRGVALGVWGAVSGAAAAIGPVLGGVLTQSLDWRWIFFVNLPVSAAAIWITLRTVTESQRQTDRKVDWAGTAAFAVFAGALTFAVVRADTVGWTSGRTGAAVAVAVVALAAFVVVERRAAHPLLDLGLLRRPSFAVVMVGALAFNAAAFGVLPYTSIWLQTLLGMSPVRAGLAVLPLAVASFVVAALGGRLLHGRSPRLVIGGGLVLIGAGALAQATLDAGSDWTGLSAGLVLAGIGVGLVSPALAGAALASVPPRNAGMAGGAVNTFRQLGFALGVAVFGTVLTSRMEGALPGPSAQAHTAAHVLAGGGASALRSRIPDATLHSAFASGLNGAALIAGILGLVAGIAVLAFLRPAPAAPAPVVRTEELEVAAAR
ncbi:MFS transporter [Streptomyces sp. NBC_01306]|uniref:MFS transporter n=1 Tax=Streptomyces sp. NBC_01306 TaxID=2903819 RepID=UPI0022590B9D|nr:MFS transporter [Streptomyces sp. NBC_01306]MCX4722705.1 MFS transporter [Streptomyces sp. NBC_01306]